MTELKTSVSHSEVESFLFCERRHYYSYGLELDRLGSSDALNRGVIGHEILETYFNALKEQQHDFENAKAKTVQAVYEIMNSHPESAVLIGEAFAAIQIFWKRGGLVDKTILAVEKDFEIGIDNISVKFVIDLIIRDTDGSIGVIDNKFVKDLYTDRDTELMGQLAKYVGFLRALGFPANWAAYNELRWYSTKNSTDETQYSFADVDLSDARIANTVREHMEVARRIVERKRVVVENGEAGMIEWSNRAPRVMNKMVCNSCPFRSLCVAELNNDNPQMVLDRDYRKKERREKMIPELETA